MKKERLVEFDLIRGIAFIFIVLQHTIGGFSFRSDISTLNLFISKFLYTMAEIATPLFTCLTGVALLYTYYDKFDIKTFYIKKLKFLVLPFVFWSVFIIIFKNKPIDKNILLTIFTGNAQYHLWYMGMILRIYLYFPIILIFFKFINKQKIYIKTLSFLLLFIGYYFVLNNYQILDVIKNFIFKNPTDLQAKLVNVTPLFYYFYFVVGAYIILNYKVFKKLIIKYKYIVIVLYCIELTYYYYIELSSSIGNPFPYIKSYTLTSISFRCISILFFYIVSYYINEKFKYVKSILVFISKYSFSAYLIHIVVIECSTAFIANSVNISDSIKLLVMGITISVGICFLLNYIPYSEYIIGNKSKLNWNKLMKIKGYLNSRIRLKSQ